MHNDISQANFTTKPRFEDANCKFNRAQISKAAKMEKKTHLETTRKCQSLRKFSQTRFSDNQRAWLSCLRLLFDVRYYNF